ncbi:MAG: OsmC family protein [Bryobacteraceae bacterium]
MSENTKAAVARCAGNGFFIATSPSGHSIAVETDGTRNSAPAPMELLLMALGSCTGVDVVAILRKKRERVTDYRVEVRGERRLEHPRGFERIEVRHIVRGRNLSETAVARAIELSDQKYCGVAASLRPVVQIVTSYEIVEETAGEAGE